MKEQLSKLEVDHLRYAVNERPQGKWHTFEKGAAIKILDAVPDELLIEAVQRRNVVIPECDARGGA